MTNCSEFVLDDLMAVTAIPVDDFIPGFSAWQTGKTIPSGQFSPTLTSSVTIGRQPAVAGGTLIPIIPWTGKARDEESDGVAGRLHTVTVTCQADDRDHAVWERLLALERTPSHLLLTFRDGTQGFVQATVDTYLMTTERDGAKTTVTFRIQDIMGIQLIV
ncbi:MAG: hypothetical protein J6Y33_03485 [Prevotella sp.]|nr:hypothetical protein [Prevotella sp.]